MCGWGFSELPTAEICARAPPSENHLAPPVMRELLQPCAVRRYVPLQRVNHTSVQGPAENQGEVTHTPWRSTTTCVLRIAVWHLSSVVRGLTPCLPSLSLKTFVSFRQDAFPLPCNGGVCRLCGSDTPSFAASAHIQRNHRWSPVDKQKSSDRVFGYSVCRSPCWRSEVCRAQEVCCAIRNCIRGYRMGT